MQVEFRSNPCVAFDLKAKNSEKSSHKLQEDLAATQQECDRLQAELQQVLLQLDAHIR